MSMSRTDNQLIAENGDYGQLFFTPDYPQQFPWQTPLESEQETCFLFASWESAWTVDSAHPCSLLGQDPYLKEPSSPHPPPDLLICTFCAPHSYLHLILSSLGTIHPCTVPIVSCASLFLPWEVPAIVIPILQRRKLRHRASLEWKQEWRFKKRRKGDEAVKSKNYLRKLTQRARKGKEIFFFLCFLHSKAHFAQGRGTQSL